MSEGLRPRVNLERVVVGAGLSGALAGALMAYEAPYTGVALSTTGSLFALAGAVSRTWRIDAAAAERRTLEYAISRFPAQGATRVCLEPRGPGSIAAYSPRIRL